MDANAVLAQARSDRPPSEWNIWPLRRDYVRISAIKWGALAVIGFAIFIPAALAMIPSDFVGVSDGVRILALVTLLLLSTLAFGAAGVVGYDIWRLTHANDFMLVITPELFIKAQPGRVIETPLEHVQHVTLNGVAMPEEGNSTAVMPLSQMFVGGRLIALANRAGIPGVTRRRVRGAPSLAYRDGRDNRVVVVCTDDAFDHMGAIYQLLRDRAATREEKIWRASFKPPLKGASAHE